MGDHANGTHDSAALGSETASQGRRAFATLLGEAPVGVKQSERDEEGSV